uniref:Uncharacterized protein n=1 Tax=Mycena chlorophos TaxID=658473 RepID=A0ABQ0L1N5_MYCCL|nr:predicted protein [Mycena chlorophos]
MFQTKSSSSTSFRDATLDGEIVEKQDPDRNKAHALTSSQIGLGERRELPLRAGREARRAKSVVPPREKHGEAFPEVPSEVLSATGVEKGSMRIRLDGEAGAGRDVIFRATTVVVQWYRVSSHSCATLSYLYVSVGLFRLYSRIAIGHFAPRRPSIRSPLPTPQPLLQTRHAEHLQRFRGRGTTRQWAGERGAGPGSARIW